MERAVLAVDVDHALTQLLQSVVAWHNAQAKKKISIQDFTTDDLDVVWGKTKEEKCEKIAQFYESEEFLKRLKPVKDAHEILKEARKSFTILAISERPRTLEKLTREWLDAQFSGIFDKLFMVNSESKEDRIARRKDLYEDLKVKVSIGSDGMTLSKMGNKVPYNVLVSAVPWNSTHENLIVLDGWTSVSSTLSNIVSELKLKPAQQARMGSKLARFTEDLVTISRKPIGFYVNLIKSKLKVQCQQNIRLQATSDGITTAIHVAEFLRAENMVTIDKISTRNTMIRRDSRLRRTPNIEIMLKRISPSA